MNKIARYIGGVGGFLIGYATYRYYPGIFLQFVIALVLYWAGKKVVKKVLVANSSKDELRKKWAYVLCGLGLLGIISPILGFIFALPGYLIATEIITAEYKDKKKLVSIGAVVTAICILNAALGVILNNAQLKPK